MLKPLKPKDWFEYTKINLVSSLNVPKVEVDVPAGAEVELASLSDAQLPYQILTDLPPGWRLGTLLQNLTLYYDDVAYPGVYLRLYDATNTLKGETELSTSPIACWWQDSRIAFPVSCRAYNSTASPITLPAESVKASRAMRIVEILFVPPCNLYMVLNCFNPTHQSQVGQITVHTKKAGPGTWMNIEEVTASIASRNPTREGQLRFASKFPVEMVCLGARIGYAMHVWGVAILAWLK